MNRVQVLPPAEAIRDPFSRLARVVEVEHRGHRIHAQPVHVVLLEEEQRVRDEKVPHLVAPEIRNERPPVLMLTQPRIVVLIQPRAIKPRQPVLVLREMAGYPVEDYADAHLMAAIHKISELIRVPKPA